MKRGFTLIEILVVVAIIGILMATTLLTLSSGRSAAHARDASRAVSQMSHYANALALLRQRPAILTYAGSKITVQLSGKAQDLSELGSPAQPIYREVNGEDAAEVEPENPKAREEETENPSSGKGVAEKTGLFFTRQILDPEELAKEDAERSFEGISFTLELLDDDGVELDEESSTRLRNQADSLAATRGNVQGWSNVHGKLDADGGDDEKAKSPETEAKPQRVVYETNGNCTPHRVTIREVQADDGGVADAKDGIELMTVTVSRSGKVTIGDEDDGSSRRSSSRSRSRSRKGGRR